MRYVIVVDFAEGAIELSPSPEALREQIGWMLQSEYGASGYRLTRVFVDPIDQEQRVAARVRAGISD